MVIKQYCPASECSNFAEDLHGMEYDKGKWQTFTLANTVLLTGPIVVHRPDVMLFYPGQLFRLANENEGNHTSSS